MEMPAILIVLLCLGGLSLADLMDDLDLEGLDSPEVKGPEPLTKRNTRSVYNLHDCPASWTRRGPSMPSMPCPPGMERPGHMFGGPPYQPYPYPPCPPWVDSQRRCHIRDRVYDGTRCRKHYGETIYARWQTNAHLSRPAEMPGTPAPPCVRHGGPF